MNDNLAYQEEPWEELIDGKMVAMSPRPTVNHSRIASRIFNIFENYLRGKRCTAFADSVDLYLTEKDRFIPDFMVVCDRNKIKWDGIYGAPDLVVEVLSPSTAKNDRTHKKDVYAKCGVREYWLVNPSDETIEQYFLDNGQFVLHEIYAVYPERMLEKMTEEERAAVITHFKCSLFDDLDILLSDIFEDLFR